MSTTTIETVELPEYSEDVEIIKQLCRDSAAVASGTTLYAGIAAMRTKMVAYQPNKTGEGYGWKGVTKAAETYDMSKGEMSKITKVVQEHLQSALECEPEEVKDFVLHFVQEHGSVGQAYDKLVSGGGAPAEPKEWSLTDAIQTLCRKAVKEGFDGETVEETFARILAEHYPTTPAE